jgi:hypothetical protein
MSLSPSSVISPLHLGQARISNSFSSIIIALHRSVLKGFALSLFLYVLPFWRSLFVFLEIIFLCKAKKGFECI